MFKHTNPKCQRERLRNIATIELPVSVELSISDRMDKINEILASHAMTI